MTLTKYVLFFLFSIFMVYSCYGPWRDQEILNSAVWSDDDSEIAFIQSKFEGRNQFPGGSDARGFQYKIGFADSLGNITRYFNDYIDGEAIDLFYMKSAGYLLAGLTHSTFTLFELDGSVKHIFEAESIDLCDSRLGEFQRLKAVPSFDGSKIVTVETTNNCSFIVKFYSIGQQIDLISEFLYKTADFDNVAWYSNNSVIIELCEGICPSGFLSADVENGIFELPESQSYYDACTFTETSSSWINNQGESIILNEGIIQISPRENLLFFDQTPISRDYYQISCLELNTLN